MNGTQLQDSLILQVLQTQLMPCLQVYEMSEAAAHQQWQRKLLYTEAGGIAATGSEGLLALRQVGHAAAMAVICDNTVPAWHLLGSLTVQATCAIDSNMQVRSCTTACMLCFRHCCLSSQQRAQQANLLGCCRVHTL